MDNERKHSCEKTFTEIEVYRAKNILKEKGMETNETLTRIYTVVTFKLDKDIFA